MLKRSEGSSLFLLVAAAALALASCRGDGGTDTTETESPPTAEATATPAAAGPVRIRKEWHSLTADEKAAYAAGVKLMQSRPETTATSWLYQGNIHGYPSDDSVCEPPSASKQPSWATCQHGTFFFLAWHRIYLYYFEQIVQAAVREATGKPDYLFNLPYWDYENPSYQQLPNEFRDPENPLYVAQRVADCNDGKECVSPSEASAVEALKRLPFCNCPAGTTCQGCTANLLPRQAFGSQFAAQPIHYSRFFGELESQPHNVVHDAIGGETGWMGDPDCAARDPIFWLHHANIDRLWQVWLNQGNRENPLGADNWKNEVFTFFDAQGNPVKKTACDILNMATQLGYEYEGVPVTNVQLCPPPTAAAPAAEPPAPEPVPLASVAPPEVRLGDAPVSVDVPVPAQAAGRLRGLAAATDEGKHAWLVVEGLRQLKKGAYYQVYLNLPEGQAPDPRGPHFVGNISLFGASHHGEGEVGHAFDISDELQDLQARSLWSGDLRVTFVRGNPERRAAAAAPFLSFRRILIEER